MRAWALAILCLLLAGCAAPLAPKSGDSTSTAGIAAPSFGAMKILDPVRSGGEPVLFQTAKGTLLVAAHPGYSHTKVPPGPEVLTPTSGQSYLYRSTDDGASWSVVTGPNGGPRNDAFGESDPDLAQTDDGKLLVMVDLGLAAPPASTEISHDDGATWPDAAPVATSPMDPVIDRPWLAQWNGTFYLLYNAGQGDWRLRDSTDGVKWTDVSTPGDGSYPGAMIAGPDGALYVGNGDKVWASTDGGKTFAASKVPGDKPMRGIVAQRPAVDAAGTAYYAWSDGFGKIRYAASHDDGKTWGRAIDITTNGTNIWPWPAAGAPGKLAVAWLGTDEVTQDPSAVKGDWFVHLALVSDADTDHPSVWTGVVPGAKAMTGGICIDGTVCEAEGKDRRLGDFITVIVDKDGYAQVAFGTTTTGHSISSPAYVMQVGGPRLR